MLTSIRDTTTQIFAQSKNITLSSPYTLLLCPPLTVVVVILLIVTGILLFPVGTLVSIITLVTVSWRAIARKISEPAFNQVTKLQSQLRKKQSRLAEAKATIRKLEEQLQSEQLQHEEQLIKICEKYEKELKSQSRPKITKENIPEIIENSEKPINSVNPGNSGTPENSGNPGNSVHYGYTELAQIMSENGEKKKSLGREDICQSDPFVPPRTKSMGVRSLRKSRIHLKGSTRHKLPTVRVSDEEKIEVEELKKKLEILHTEVQQLASSKTELENKIQKSELERKMMAGKMKIESEYYNINKTALTKTMNDLKQSNMILKNENNELRRIRSHVPLGQSVEEQVQQLRSKELEFRKLCLEMRQVISTVGNSGILKSNGKQLDIDFSSSGSENSDSEEYTFSGEDGEDGEDEEEDRVDAGEVSLEKPRNANKMEEKADVNT